MKLEKETLMCRPKMLVGLALVAIAFGAPASVEAQSNLAGSTVSGSVSGTLFDGSTNKGFNSGEESVTADVGAAILHIDEGAEHAGATGLGLLDASASPGRLRVRILGEATASLFLQIASSHVRAVAAFHDTISILRDRPGAAEIPLGTVLLVKGSLELNGFFFADGHGQLSQTINGPATDYLDGVGDVRLLISGAGASPYPGGIFGRQSFGYTSLFPQTVRRLTSIEQSAPARISIERAFLWGFPNFIEIAMTLDGVAFASQHDAEHPAYSSIGEFEADFSRTVTWGGISSISRFDTGEVLTEWIATSASGLDYSKPFAEVPEPATFATCLFGIVCLACRSLSRAYRT